MSKSNEPTLIIDPGHGGIDPGANGFGLNEKEWCLRISLYQYERLKELGANVAITRTDDRTLDSVARTNLIRGKYTYCVSNHWNAFNGQARGVETIHSIHANPEFATNMANALVEVSGLPMRRVFSRRNNSGTDFYFMHRLTGSTQTVIIEYAFMDHRADHDWYLDDDNFYKAAEAAIEVMCKQLGVAYKSPAGTTKVEKTPKPTPNNPETLYKVQAGAFRQRDNAERMLELMQSEGMDAVIMERDKLFRVQIGAYAVYENAERMLKRVKEIEPHAFISIEGKMPPQGKPKPTPKPKPKKSVKEVALEVYRGQGGWGNNPGRRRKLEAEGYNYDAVQAEVEKLINANRSPKPTPIKARDRVRVNQNASEYATGGSIPARVRGQVYTVHQKPRTQGGRREVLLSEIMSWVYESDVTKV